MMPIIPLWVMFGINVAITFAVLARWVEFYLKYLA